MSHRRNSEALEETPHTRARTHLVKIEHQIQFANASEVTVEELDEQVNRLQVHQLVVIDVDAYGEKEAGVSSVDDVVFAPLQWIDCDAKINWNAI